MPLDLTKRHRDALRKLASECTLDKVRFFDRAQLGPNIGPGTMADLERWGLAAPGAQPITGKTGYRITPAGEQIARQEAAPKTAPATLQLRRLDDLPNNLRKPK